MRRRKLGVLDPRITSLRQMNSLQDRRPKSEHVIQWSVVVSRPAGDESGNPLYLAVRSLPSGAARV